MPSRSELLGQTVPRRTAGQTSATCALSSVQRVSGHQSGFSKTVVSGKPRSAQYLCGFQPSPWSRASYIARQRDKAGHRVMCPPPRLWVTFCRPGGFVSRKLPAPGLSHLLPPLGRGSLPHWSENAARRVTVREWASRSQTAPHVRRLFEQLSAIILSLSRTMSGPVAASPSRRRIDQIARRTTGAGPRSPGDATARMHMALIWLPWMTARRLPLALAQEGTAR